MSNFARAHEYIVAAFGLAVIAVSGYLTVVQMAV